MAPVLAAGLIVACDDALQGVGPSSVWGFVVMSATQSGGSHFTEPEGIFFRGNLAAVPNADFTTQDSCADGPYTSNTGGLAGVSYLDAGPTVDAIIGGVTRTLSRTANDAGLSYLLPAPVEFTPGDSIVVNIQGTAGGFPGGTIRAKTAEAFTFPTFEPPGGTETIHLTWSVPQDPRSAMVVSLRYAGTGSTLNRQVLCTFIDDGVDSIPFRWHANWSSTAGPREVVATRLRTHYVAAADANLCVVSTYQVPTPPNP
jgi:hypothetical protein